MTQRNTERETGDENLAYWRSLIAAVPVDLPSQQRRVRVKRRLDAERARRKAGWTWRLPVWRTRFALTFAVLAVVCGVGLAAVRSGWAQRLLSIVASVPKPPRPTGAQAVPSARARVAAAPPVAIPPVAIPEAPAAPLPAASPTPAIVVPSGPSRVEEANRMIEATRALRRDHDPALAGRLLAAYLEAYPDGLLVEEAMALSIEAAEGRHDPAAAGLADRYLARFPHGQFTPLAQRAREGATRVR